MNSSTDNLIAREHFTLWRLKGVWLEDKECFSNNRKFGSFSLSSALGHLARENCLHALIGDDDSCCSGLLAGRASTNLHLGMWACRPKYNRSFFCSDTLIRETHLKASDLGHMGISAVNSDDQRSLRLLLLLPPLSLLCLAQQKNSFALVRITAIFASKWKVFLSPGLRQKLQAWTLLESSMEGLKWQTS